MLELAKREDSFDFLPATPHSAKIQSLFRTYGGGNSFARFWVQDGTAAVSSVDGNITVECCESADFDELREFLAFIPKVSVTLNEKHCGKLGIEDYSSSYIVEFCSEAGDCGFSSQADYRDVYNLLKSKSFPLGSYESFLADFVSRLNKNAADLAVIYEDGKLMSTASALFAGKDSVLLGAIATDSAAQGKGYASLLVKALASKYKNCGRRVFVFCREDSLKNFYEKCGFSVYGKWAQV
jgi:N-acetylglutamate synthase-like GNAT family acetyltransferase